MMTYQFMLVLLSDVVEVDVGDGVVVPVVQVEEEVLGAVEVYPGLSIRVVIWQWVWLKHLSLQLFLLEKQFLHHLLAYVDSIGDLLLL